MGFCMSDQPPTCQRDLCGAPADYELYLQFWQEGVGIGLGPSVITGNPVIVCCVAHIGDAISREWYSAEQRAQIARGLASVNAVAADFKTAGLFVRPILGKRPAL